MIDLYEVLQVHPRAEPEVIRAAYRILARKYHPDHGGDAKRMTQLNDAWDVLGDPGRRAEYDAARLAAAKPATGTAASHGATAGARGAGFAPGPASTGSASASTPSSATAGVSHAGPPPGNPSGTVLDFGRYSGWSLGEIARRDPDYLEWLARATLGRRLRSEIDTLLRQRRGSATPPGARR